MKLRTFFASTLLALTTSAIASPYSNVVFFGDSLSDIGNTGGAPATNKDPSQSSNLIWTNDLTNLLFPNQKLYPSQHLPSGSPPFINKYNIDYAYGGAITGSGRSVPSLIEQVKNFISYSRDRPNENSLYMIWCGGNDLLAMFPHLQTLRNQQEHRQPIGLKMALKENPEYILKSNSNDAIDNSISNISVAVNNLIRHDVPASHIFVLDLPDLANIPLAQQAAKSHPGILPIITSISTEFDTKLQSSLAQILPAKNFIHDDELMANIISDPAKYNFNPADIHLSCSGNGGMPKCDGFIYFDNIHPTKHAHSLTANFVYQAITAANSV